MSEITVDMFRPAPFWFWNHRIEREEISRQLDLMLEGRVKEFYIHSRDGLLTPYGSDEWFDLIRYTAHEAFKRGMKCHLYDEDGFPSGNHGGGMIMEHPEYISWNLVFQTFTPDDKAAVSAVLGWGNVLEAWAVRCDEENNVLEKRDISGAVGILRKSFFRRVQPTDYFGLNLHYPHFRAGTFCPELELNCTLPGPEWKVFVVIAKQINQRRFRHLADLANPDAVDLFIEKSIKRYADAVRDIPGDAPGIFTDEPSVGALPPWTAFIEKELEKSSGTPWRGRFHQLFTGTSAECRKTRLEYWSCLNDLFRKNFFLRIRDCCRENHLVFCGHCDGEESATKAENALNILPLLRSLDIPGCDQITTLISWEDQLLKLNLPGVLAASAAEQSGKIMVQCEALACAPYNFGLDGMKKHANWLLSLGVNRLILHAFHYSIDGYRKDDAGKSYFHQDPAYKTSFPRFSDYAGRLGMILAGSQSTARVCLVWPQRSFQELYPGELDRAKMLENELILTVKKLLDQQIQFNIADETILEEAVLDQTGFTCGKKHYEVLLLPFVVERPFLNRFRENGIAVAGSVEELSAFRNPVEVTAADGSAVRHVNTQYRKLSAGGSLLYCCSASAEKRRFKLSGAPQDACRYSAELDCWFALEDTAFELQPFGAALFCFNADVPRVQEAFPPEPEPDFDYMENPEFCYYPQFPGVLKWIKQYQIVINGQDFGMRDYALLRDIAGAEPPIPAARAAMDQAPFRKTFFPAENAVFTACFDLTEEELPNLVLVGESESFSGLKSITLNGVGLTGVRRRIYDPWCVVYDLAKSAKAGRNTLILQFEGDQFDGVRSILTLAQSSPDPGW